MGKLNIRGADRVFSAVVYLILISSFLFVSLPLFYVLMCSFSTKNEILTRGFFLIPREWSLDSYGYLLTNKGFTTAFRNAVQITFFGTAINIAVTSLMAYGLSKSWLKGKKIIMLMVMFTMIFQGGMIPTYLVVKELHLINSFWAIWLVGAVGPFNLIVMNNFFKNIPVELEEAARIDGSGEWRLFFAIILPLSMPAIATFTLLYMVANWNAYFNAILYLNNSSKWPLQVYLRQMLIETSEAGLAQDSGGFEFGPQVKLAAVVVTAVPLLIVYPFLQKYFAQGMMLGSVKG